MKDKVRDGNKIVWVNGCFDLLHEGHVEMLKEAKEQGDYLIVGLNSDESVKINKGDGRPVDNLETRKRKLMETGFVDEIIVFGEKSPVELIKKIKPDVIVKGHDQKIEPELADEFNFFRASKYGDVSTTKLLSLPR